MSYLRSAGREHGGKVAYCMPQIDVNKGAGYSKMIQKRIMLCFWMKAFTSRDRFDSLFWRTVLAGSISFQP